MADSPVADIILDERVVRSLLSEQVPHLASACLRHVGSGWDNDLWRLGEDLVVRLPRRASAAPLILHEAWAFERLPDARVPHAVHVGTPSDVFAFPWLLSPWTPGVPASDLPRAQRTGWAGDLADLLSSIHAVDAHGAPVNAVRGGALSSRAEAVHARLRGMDDDAAAVVSSAFEEGATARPFAGAPALVHADPHPANMIIADGRLAALIDFGDVTAGDPAVDLAAAWLVFDALGRSAFIGRMPSHDEATWLRARGWAAVIASALLSASDDRPGLLRCGRETVAQLAQPTFPAA